jgi:NAD(P)-dependent dehydrogenase (short-subunit alcohol dehydrogenase family)
VSSAAGKVVDIWINNAGVGSDQSDIVDTVPELLNSVMDVNIRGVVFGSQVAPLEDGMESTAFPLHPA